MKQLTLLITTMLAFSCQPKQDTKAEAEQPIAEPSNQPSASSTINPQSSPLVAQYYDLLRTPNGVEYGVISINRIDKAAKEISFSTLFRNERKHFTLPFLVSKTAVEGEEKIITSYEMKTDQFMLFLNETSLQVNIYEGVPQKAVRMRKLPRFKYQQTHRPIFKFRRLFGAKFATTSPDKIANASTSLLKSKDAENLYALDLKIMKNSIYARHGSAFKDPLLTNFFAKTDWYTPIFTLDEVQQRLTKNETKNINLINRYEKNAQRYRLKMSR